MTSKIIFLNGCSSAGKTSLVKAIQYLSEEPWLTFGIDDGIDAMPNKYWGSGEKAAEGFHFISSIDREGFPITEVKTGPYGAKVWNSVPKIVKLLADDGFNIIVDEVILDKKELEIYAAALKSHRVYYVKVNCELALMEEREILRGDRSLGMARAQMLKMKDLSWNYDLEIDTSRTSSFTKAQDILEFLKERAIGFFKNT